MHQEGVSVPKRSLRSVGLSQEIHLLSRLGLIILTGWRLACPFASPDAGGWIALPVTASPHGITAILRMSP